MTSRVVLARPSISRNSRHPGAKIEARNRLLMMTHLDRTFLFAGLSTWMSPLRMNLLMSCKSNTVPIRMNNRIVLFVIHDLFVFTTK
jgi:hypothetical protein